MEDEQVVNEQVEGFEQNSVSKAFIKVVDQLLKTGKHSYTSISKDLKWNKSAMSAVVNGKRDVPIDVWDRFHEVNEFVNILNKVGESETGFEKEKDIVENGELIKNPSLRFHRGPGGPINFYDMDFMAGNIDFYEDRQLISPAYTMDIPEFSGCTAFRVYNDSMEPLIKSGSIVFGTKIENWREYLDLGQIYGIIRHEKTPLLKYIRKSPKGEDYFLLKSENKDYDDTDLPISHIKSIWLIHGWINKRT